MKKRILLFTLLFAFYTEGSFFAQNLNIVKRSQMSFTGQTLANIWGHTKNGREYALVGGSKGMIIVDVTNPDAPKQIVQIPGVNNKWKEIKTYKDVAYVTTEGGGGLQIINLAALPDTNWVAYRPYSYVGDISRQASDSTIIGKLSAIHALHVDTSRGFAYLYGGNSAVSNGGALVLDLKPDAYYPKYAGQYNLFAGNANYIHDGYVDSDTLFAAHIYRGEVAVIDFRNKKQPRVITTFKTPTTFPHNTWLTPDRKTVLTTDENTNSFLAAYSIADLTNVRLLDKIQNTSAGSVVHNTQILPNGNYTVTSWYRDGIQIADITRPQNMVAVGTFDTYEQAQGSGFNGAWGVYPYFASGTLVVSNIEDGLVVLTPQYRRACYLEGIVRDSVSRQLLSGVLVKINSTDVDKKAVSDLTGNYRSGQVTPGTFSVTFSKAGYYPKTVNVPLSNGQVAQRDIDLVKKPLVNIRIHVEDAATQAVIVDAKMNLTSPDATLKAVTAAQGIAALPDIIQGNYNTVVGAWGYLHKTLTINVQSGVFDYFVKLDKGYQDDFWEDFGWQVSGAAQMNTFKGRWDRSIPVGTTNGGVLANPNIDDPNDIGNQAYITGNTGGQATADDVDTSTILTSPLMKLRSYANPNLNYSIWFFNLGEANNPNGRLQVFASNGRQEVRIDSFKLSHTGWLPRRNISLRNLLPLTDSMSIRFVAQDITTTRDFVVEAGVDAFKVTEGALASQEFSNQILMTAAPNPFGDVLQINYRFDKPLTTPTARLRIFDIIGKEIYSQNLSNTEGSISVPNHWQAGLYILQIEVDGKLSHPIKMVKN